MLRVQTEKVWRFSLCPEENVLRISMEVWKQLWTQIFQWKTNFRRGVRFRTQGDFFKWIIICHKVWNEMWMAATQRALQLQVTFTHWHTHSHSTSLLPYKQMYRTSLSVIQWRAQGHFNMSSEGAGGQTVAPPLRLLSHGTETTHNLLMSRSNNTQPDTKGGGHSSGPVCYITTQRLCSCSFQQIELVNKNKKKEQKRNIKEFCRIKIILLQRQKQGSAASWIRAARGRSLLI